MTITGKTGESDSIPTEEGRVERVILVGVEDASAGQTDPGEAERSLDELEALAESAGAEVVGMALQRREKPDPALYIGKGKLQEVLDAAKALDADTILFDDELTGSQIRNLEARSDCKILDRTLLILDIFAARARSREGRLQVELAQQQYRLSRLAGLGKSLSRQGGGIGTRGPGETRLESDRRHIARRISLLKNAIADVQANRARTRESRRRGEVCSIAFIGYTNAGKSTLINALCDADLYTEDMVFATLDPAVRKLPLGASVPTVAVDTVGFIRKLPHHLIDAFSSTLEEAAQADILVHVVDASDPDRDRQEQVAVSLLKDLGASGLPRIRVFNKCDRMPTAVDDDPDGKPRPVYVSALRNAGLETLRTALRDAVDRSIVSVVIRLPYADAGALSRLRRLGRVDDVRYEEEAIVVCMTVPEDVLGRLDPFQPHLDRS